mmetsp:Transcript_49429/g.127560  ORF Transcript_49429/g.127560 Transcript_49429/m.127560 type:complete len:134 (-) Transcript_49429:74-475(-)
MRRAAAKLSLGAAIGLLLLLDGRRTHGPGSLAAAQGFAGMPMSTTTTEVPLNLQFPGLLKCDPPKTKGCIERCSSSAFSKPSKTDVMCSLLRCLADCTALVAGDCADSGFTACELIKTTMNFHEQFCIVDCVR